MDATYKNRVIAKLDALPTETEQVMNSDFVTENFISVCENYTLDYGNLITITDDKTRITKHKKEIRYLFFDTETTGIPANYKAPVTDTDNWPRMIQIAWLVFDKNGKQVTYANHIIKPDGFEIPKASTDIHGITTERANEEGMEIKDVLSAFTLELNYTTCLVAHNIAFDEKIVGAELVRAQINSKLFDVHQVCTMLKSVDYCQIPNKGGFKWPKLQELHKKLFGKEYDF